jgi:N12 class adenine-specific DNA methylase
MYQFRNLPVKGGVKTKLNNNIACLKWLRRYKKNPHPITAADQDLLAKWVGWGTVASAINKEVLELVPDLDLNSDNAFLTPAPIVEAMWHVLEQLGFSYGRILEPSSNIGLFPGLQTTWNRARSEWCLVEIDSSASAIAKILIDDAIAIYGCGFESTDIPNSTFDLVIGNVPFGLVPPFDPDYEDIPSSTLHNYFFAKSLDKLRSGGLMALITSIGTLDSEFPKYLHAQGARLVGAVRLPNTALAEAGTQVTADLIILQKCPHSPEPNPNWLDVVATPILDENDEPLCVNRYFIENPDKVLGTWSHSQLYGNSRIAVAGDKQVDIKAAIINAFAKLNLIYELPNFQRPALKEVLLPESCIGLNPGSFLLKEGKLYQYQRGVGLIHITEHAERITAGIELKNALDSLVDAELNDREDMEERRAQLVTQYNLFVKKYGNLLNRRKRPSTLKVFADDSELVATCCALEEEICFESETGSKTWEYKPAEILTSRVNAPMRQEGTLKISVPTDAVHESLSRRGRIDLPFIAVLLECSEKDAIGLLKGKNSEIFFDPDLGEWVSRYQYLSGDTRAKLRTVRQLAETDGELYLEKWLFDNEKVLTTKNEDGHYVYISSFILPPATAEIRASIASGLKQKLDIDSELDAEIFIDAGAGASWIPTSDIQQFCSDKFGGRASQYKVEHIPELARWGVDGPKEYAQKSEFSSTGAEGKRGGKNALQVLEAALNMTPFRIKIYDDDAIDVEASEAATVTANSALERLKEEFKKWLWLDAERALRLTLIYNSIYPRPLRPQYDGSYLKLPGSNSAIQLKPHQKNAIARGIQERRLFLLHPVGYGKTFVYCAVAMECKRLGLVDKAFISVLNDTVSQFVGQFKTLYPKAKLLIAEDGGAQTRNATLRRCQTGNYDCIILAHTAFYGIPIGWRTKVQYISEELSVIEGYLQEVDATKESLLHGDLLAHAHSLRQEIERLEVIGAIEDAGNDPQSMMPVMDDLLDKGAIRVSNSGQVKFVPKQQRLTRDEYVKLMGEKERDKTIKVLKRSLEKAVSHYCRNSIALNWEDIAKRPLICFDELQMLKNIRYPSKIAGTISGITNTDTQRSLNSLLKFNWTLRNGGRIGGGTGLFPEVSFSEMFNLLRLFAPDEIEETGNAHFDSFIGNFGEISTQPEFTSMGGIKKKTRISGFKNQDEMLDLAATFTDFAPDPEKVGIKRPQLHRYTITSPLSDEQAAINEDIKNWLKAWQKRRPPKYVHPKTGNWTNHNPLTLTSMGSAASIDPRLVKEVETVECDTKLHRLIHNAWWVWQATRETKATQFIFCNSGVPKPHNRFTVYRYIRDCMVALGVPETEVAFIHEYDAKTKQKLFDKMNNGETAMLLASTRRGGTGVNAQGVRNTWYGGAIAAHLLDLDWSPPLQRLGRVVRQGNPHDDVWAFDYGTLGAGNQPGFDAWKANLVRHRAAMAHQYASGKLESRRTQDIGDDASYYLVAAAIMSGNTAALEYAQVKDQLRQKNHTFKEQQTRLSQYRYYSESCGSVLGVLEAKYKASQVDQETVKEHGSLTGDTFSIQIGKTLTTKVQEADIVLQGKINAIIKAGKRCQHKKIGQIAGLDIVVSFFSGKSIESLDLAGVPYTHNEQTYRIFYPVSLSWVFSEKFINAIRTTLREVRHGYEVDRLSKKIDAEREHQRLLPERITYLTSEVSKLGDEVSALTAKELELRSQLDSKEDEQEAWEPGGIVEAPTPAIYTGVDETVIEWIKTLPPPPWITDIFLAQAVRLLRMQCLECSHSKTFEWFILWHQSQLQLLEVVNSLEDVFS